MNAETVIFIVIGAVSAALIVEAIYVFRQHLLDYLRFATAGLTAGVWTYFLALVLPRTLFAVPAFGTGIGLVSGNLIHYTLYRIFQQIKLKRSIEAR